MKTRIIAAAAAAWLVVVAWGAAPSQNIPIGNMPVASSANGSAFMPIIQPYPGRSTNDNFRVSVDALFLGRNVSLITNSYVTNLYVMNEYATNIYVTNLFNETLYSTNIYVTNLFAGDTYTTNLYVTNLYANTEYVTNLYVTNLYVDTIIGDAVVWTNAGPWIAPLAFTNTLRVLPSGSIIGGAGWDAYYSDETVGLAVTHDTSLGETNYNRLWIGATDNRNAPTNWAYMRYEAASGAIPGSLFTIKTTLGGSTESWFEVDLRPNPGVASIELYNQGFLNFAVNSGSGYSGVGNQFLSDDGTYKPGTGTTINPTDGFLPYRLNAATFDDSPMYRIDATTVGVDTIDANTVAATNLQSGGVVYTGADGVLTNVATGTGFLYNDGSNTNLVWTGGSLSDICLWTNRAGVLQPADLTLPVGWTNQLVLGPGTTNVVYRSGTALRYTNGAINNVNFEVYNGAGKNTALNVSTGSGAVQTSEPVLVFTAGSKSASVDGSNSSLRPNNPAEMSLGLDSTPWLNLYLTNQVVWGPGTTNVLYRSGADLYYTNSGSTVGLNIVNGSGGILKLQSRNGANNTIDVSSGNLQVTPKLVTASVEPYNTTSDLGQNGDNTYRDEWLSRNLYIRGFFSGTNYSRGVISHSGTNGAVVFDSQALGTAGTARPFLFTNAPVIFHGFTKAQKAALTPVDGMMLYQTDNTPGFRQYVNGAWVMVSTVADP